MASTVREVPKILVVDDVEANRFALRNIIQQLGYQPILAENGEQAIKVAQRFDLQLVILDVAMPVMDGYQVCEELKKNVKSRNIPIIFISAFDNPKDVAKGFEVGGADYITKPFVPEVVKARITLQLKLYETTRELQDLNRKLQISVSEQMKRVEREKKNVLYALLRVARENSAYDPKHMERMSRNCRVLTEAMQLTLDYGSRISNQYVDTIEVAAPICDIGNVAIPTSILQKKEALSPEENLQMQRHTIVGEQILQDVDVEDQNNAFIEMSRDIAKYHHENWDGSGYPSGIKGDEIPLSAQIIGIISAYCALTEDRSYRKAFMQEEALEIMKKDSGVKFNPVIFDILYKIKRQLR